MKSFLTDDSTTLAPIVDVVKEGVADLIAVVVVNNEVPDIVVNDLDTMTPEPDVFDIKTFFIGAETLGLTALRFKALDFNRLATVGLEPSVPDTELQERVVLDTETLELGALDTDALELDSLDTETSELGALDTETLELSAMDAGTLEPGDRDARILEPVNKLVIFTTDLTGVELGDDEGISFGQTREFNFPEVATLEADTDT